MNRNGYDYQNILRWDVPALPDGAWIYLSSDDRDSQQPEVLTKTLRDLIRKETTQTQT